MIGRNPKPTFWLDESGSLRGLSESSGQPLADSPIVAVSLLKRPLDCHGAIGVVS